MSHDTHEQGKPEHRGSLQVSPVELDEMAFAMALFFAAARGQVPMKTTRAEEFELERDLRPGNLTFANVSERLAETEAKPEEFQLACAVTVIWQHYEGAKHGDAICSRLLAFYLLVARHRDAMADGSAEQGEQDLSLMILEPATIRVVATAPVTSEGQFEDREFRKMMRGSGESGENVIRSELSSIHSATRRHAPISDVVQDLAKLLFACESTIARSDHLAAPQFRVFQRLCKPFAAVSGAQNLQPLLTRALASIRGRYSWMTTAHVVPSGQIEGIDSHFLETHPQEALEGELALMASLVELLRALLGDAVTIQLLRSVWPLAFIRADTLNPQ